MAEAQIRVPGVEARAGKFPGPSLIPALNAIQERVGWLPREELVALSRDVHRPLYEIEGLISFYPHFRTDPPQQVQLRVCHDLSCWLRGADERIARLKERYGADTDVEFVEGSCLGRCDIAPACTVNEAPVPMDAADAAVTTAKETAPAVAVNEIPAAAAADLGAVIGAARSGMADEPEPRSFSADTPWANDLYA
ncbi:MAG: NAD(P)H-dependent oxidoreductase subunit E, partial [Trebonia sp.]|uniref:NADH-quinone oxidoreductase subunit NuoE family protein n=1 Tax=Trebonia sp. TaxID=2767075 RepID=UPI003C76B412